MNRLPILRWSKSAHRGQMRLEFEKDGKRCVAMVTPKAVVLQRGRLVIEVEQVRDAQVVEMPKC